MNALFLTQSFLEPVCVTHWLFTPLLPARDLLLRDNLFEIITGSRTFYIQVQLPRSRAAAERQRRRGASCFVAPSLQVYPSWRYVPLSVNALLLMCDKDSASEKKVHNRPWRSQQRLSCQRASLRWENSCVWQQRPHRMGSCSKGACKHVQFIFVCSRKKTEALTNINQQENETKKVQFSLKAVLISELPRWKKRFDLLWTWFDKLLLDFDMYVYVAVESAAFISESFRSLSPAFTSKRVGVLKGIWTLQVWLSLVEVILINSWSL